VARGKHSRKEFLGISGIAAAGAVGAGGVVGTRAASAAAAAAAALEPDMVVLNATVHTMDSQHPRVEAFAIKDGRFAAVGSTERIEGMAGRRTERFDAQGMTIVPGFIDTHLHPAGTTLVYEVLVGNPYTIEFVSIQSIIDKLKAKAATLPADWWVEGYFHDDTKLTDGRQVTRQDLDQVSTEHPVVVRHRGGHVGFYNSRAFELAGITKDTPDPFGGTYGKDSDGELSGLVTDRARDPFNSVGNRPTYTAAQQAERDKAGLAFISEKFVEFGLTSVHHSGGPLATLQDLREEGKLLHRVTYELGGSALEAAITAGIRTGFGDERIMIGATTEHTVDGSFSERTMSMVDPYPGSNPPYYGNITETQPTLDEWVERVHRAGIQVNCHTNGVPAIEMYLNSLDRVNRIAPRADARPKFTHCTAQTNDTLRRIKKVGGVPAPFTSYAYYNAEKFHFYGAKFMRMAMAYRSFANMGIVAGAGSDFSPGPFDSLMGIQGMVTRKGWNGEVWGPNQRITVDQALAVCTINGAYSSFEEGRKGSITAGKLADYVVLEDDVKKVADDKIKDIKINRTVVGGTTVYER
jgi:predicted amidohydrolase YtcJ